MQTIVLRGETDWEGWRRVTRALILAGVAPATLAWTVGGEATDVAAGSGSFQVPRELVSLAALAIQARDPDRFGLLFSLFWRVHQGERLLGGDPDPDLTAVRRMALAVRADAHRMRTHIRYLAVPEGNTTRFVGWFEPAHFVLAANAQLIVRRFPDLALSIVTPDGAAHWDRSELRFGSGLRQVADDATLRTWWEAEHETLLRAAMPEVSVPEAEELDEIPRPPDRAPLGPVVLHPKSDPALRDSANEAAVCQRCPLYAPATQMVFGEGPADAAALFVGEQPGDQEDTIGRPFVGPAGQIMDRAMEEAGLDRRMVYVTNAVKHFKFTQRGKRRIHQTPEVPEIQACKFWLDVERVHLRPRLVVLMGGSAARAGLGRGVTISRERGRPMRAPDGQSVFVTVHPSFLLRIPDAAAKAREYEAFVRDLRAIKALIAAEDSD